MSTIESGVRTKLWGKVPVPWTVSWTGEERFFVSICPHADRPAICQAIAPGEGKPQFGKPHAQRQREAVANSICDVCGKPLALRTKVSLSHARPVPHSANGFEILQVEPLLHKECAALSLKHCPSLLRDIGAGTLRVRQVLRSRVQFAIMTSEYVASLTGERREAVGHAKVQLLRWKDRDALWLESASC